MGLRCDAAAAIILSSCRTDAIGFVIVGRHKFDQGTDAGSGAANLRSAAQSAKFSSRFAIIDASAYVALRRLLIMPSLRSGSVGIEGFRELAPHSPRLGRKISLTFSIDGVEPEQVQDGEHGVGYVNPIHVEGWSDRTGSNGRRDSPASSRPDGGVLDRQSSGLTDLKNAWLLRCHMRRVHPTGRCAEGTLIASARNLAYRLCAAVTGMAASDNSCRRLHL